MRAQRSQAAQATPHMSTSWRNALALPQAAGKGPARLFCSRDLHLQQQQPEESWHQHAGRLDAKKCGKTACSHENEEGEASRRAPRWRQRALKVVLAQASASSSKATGWCTAHGLMGSSSQLTRWRVVEKRLQRPCQESVAGP